MLGASLTTHRSDLDGQQCCIHCAVATAGTAKTSCSRLFLHFVNGNRLIACVTGRCCQHRFHICNHKKVCFVITTMRLSVL